MIEIFIFLKVSKNKAQMERGHLVRHSCASEKQEIGLTTMKSGQDVRALFARSFISSL